MSGKDLKKSRKDKIMGFNSFHNSIANPAETYYRWSGGLKNVQLPDGTEAKQLKGELVFFNGEEMETTELPFSFCVLEQTSSITGFSPAGNTRFYSNEVTSFDEPMKVTRRTDAGSEVIAEGHYQSIKGNLPEGCKFQTNLYIYNPANDKIERLNLKGSALSAWIEFGQKNKGIYEHVITMEAGEKKTVGTVDFLPPKFSIGQRYTDSDMAKLVEKDKVVVEYLKDKREMNLKGATEVDNDVIIDQTPASYEGEQSQDTSASPDNNQEINLTEIPF